MGKTEPAISVIIIVRNNEELLPRAVDSVLAQICADFELIIINDCSMDNTGSVVDAYTGRDQRIKPYHLDRNVGRAMARNTGMAAARGKYIFFLDSDDYLPDTAFKDLYEVAEQDKADIVYGRIQSFDQASGKWFPDHYADFFIEPERHNFRLDDNLDLVDDHSIIGRLYRREMLEGNNIAFSTVRKNGEDVLFSFYSAYYAKSLSTIPAKKVYFYNSGNYFGTATEDKICDARDNVIEILDFVMKKGSSALKERMFRKTAIYAGKLYRAQTVYEKKFIQYLETLSPLVENMPENILHRLSSYERCFAEALIRRDFNEAYLAWKEHNQDATVTCLVQCPEMLYNSLSWRLTSPLRRIRRLLLRLENKILGRQIGV